MRKALLTFGVMLLIGLGSFALPVTAQTVESEDNTVTVETVPGQTLTQIVTERTEKSWPWYVVRASGIIAGVSLVLLLLSGITSVTGHFFRLLDPLTAWASHRALGITFLASVLIHMFTLLFDNFVPFTLVDLFVPWASSYRPVTLWGMNLGSLYIALGVLAFYGSIIVVLTSLLLVDRKPKLWKLVHYLSYFIIFNVFVHALFLGTDTSSGTGRALWIAGNVTILIAIIVRLRRAGVS